jgi:hypothetical protein
MKRLTEFRRQTGSAGEDDWLFLNRFGTGPIHAEKALETLQSAAKRVGLPTSLGIFFVTGTRPCCMTREFRWRRRRMRIQP